MVHGTSGTWVAQNGELRSSSDVLKEVVAVSAVYLMCLMAPGAETMAIIVLELVVVVMSCQQRALGTWWM